MFEAGAPLYAATRGAHSCLLMTSGQKEYILREDIGRHNALDKAVGHAARKGINLAETILYTSGRVPVDMARKAIACGVPVLASHAVPTAQAVVAAKTYGLTLIGQVTSERLTVFYTPSRP